MNEQELKARTKMKDAVIAGSDYDQFLSALKIRIQTARLSAARAVNRDLILLYWDIGRALVEKQKLLNWGDSVIEMVAKDLQKAFPEVRGFSADSIWRMRQFFTEYSDSAFLEQAVPEMKKSRGGVLAQAVPELARGSNSTAAGAPGFARGSTSAELARGCKPRASGEPKARPLTKHNQFLSQSVREVLAAVSWGHPADVLTDVVRSILPAKPRV